MGLIDPEQLIEVEAEPLLATDEIGDKRNVENRTSRHRCFKFPSPAATSTIVIPRSGVAGSPHVQQDRSSNGLRVVSAELPHTRSATVSVYVGAGSRYELDEDAGLSHFSSTCCSRAHRAGPPPRDRRGDRNRRRHPQRRHRPRSHGLLREGAPHGGGRDHRHPLRHGSRSVMDRAELEKERNVILEELASVEDSPAELAGILIDETLWPGQPLGRNVGGTPASVRAIQPEAVDRYLAAQYVPSNMVLVVAGNVRHAEVLASAERWLGDMPDAKPRPWYPCSHAMARLGSRSSTRIPNRPTSASPTRPSRSTTRTALSSISSAPSSAKGCRAACFSNCAKSARSSTTSTAIPANFATQAPLRSTRRATRRTPALRSKCRSPRSPGSCRPSRPANSTRASRWRRAASSCDGRHPLRRGLDGQPGAPPGHILTVDEAVAKIDAVTADDILRVGRALLQPEKAVIATVGPFDGDRVFSG